MVESLDASGHLNQTEKGERWGFEDLEPDYSRVSILAGTFFLDLLTENTGISGPPRLIRDGTGPDSRFLAEYSSLAQDRENSQELSREMSKSL